MPSRAVLNGVLAGFLGTYTSRYSDFDGYWLFGFLVESANRVTFDLLAPDKETGAGPLTIARQLATQRFVDQLGKSRLNPSLVREARLMIERLADDGSVPGQHFRNGFNLRFHVSATADTGRQFEREATVFVAPHDPHLESRSTRAK